MDDLFKTYGVLPAIAENGSKLRDWVYSVAKHVDVESEAGMRLARGLGAVLRIALAEYDWIGASSNNLFWTGTDAPLRMVCIPGKEGHVVLANPEILELGGFRVLSYECCGSFPGHIYVAQRRAFVMLSGFLIGENGEASQVEMKLGLDGVVEDSCPLNSMYALTKASVAQHELDHIDGRVLPDHAFLYT